MAMTKQEAVEHLIDGAIRAYDDGDHVCVITLAGAAEGAMPPAETQIFFEIAQDAILGKTPERRREVVSQLNAERDWLKHYNERQPVEMMMSDSILWIVRAMSKFQAVYGRQAETAKMKEFFEAARAFDPED